MGLKVIFLTVQCPFHKDTATEAYKVFWKRIYYKSFSIRYQNLSHTTVEINPQPYNIIQLDHTAFQKYSIHPYFSSIRLGKTAGDPQVTIHTLPYVWAISFYKLNYSEEYQLLPRKTICQPNSTDCFQQLYNAKLLVTRIKYNHLQELKCVIPRDLHSFYVFMLLLKFW